MASKVQTKSFMQKIGDVQFYCELRGRGPSVVLIPSGEGDCGLFATVADALADEFTVFTLDMRGCSRTVMPPEWAPTSAEELADDVAALVKVLNLVPASFYGCSSGGQALLCLGLYHREIVRNLIIHEPAVTFHAPLSGPSLPGGGVVPTFMRMAASELVKKVGSYQTAISILLRAFSGNEQIWDAQDPELLNRVYKNGEAWMTKYVDHVERFYSDEELTKISKVPLIFSNGLFSPAWLTEATRRVAEKCGVEPVWMPCGHYPQVTIPDVLVEHIRANTRKQL
jgi:pimeloyl-ACP methyl ester carboxylesterase